MSLEFKATDGKPEVISAATTIDREISSSNSIWEYLDSIHAEYSKTANGKGELGQMTRAAEFITGRDSHSNHESIYAFLNGELLGQLLLQKRGVGEEDRSSLAQGYMSRLHKESLHFSSPQESEGERFARIEEMAATAQQDLTSGFMPNITNRAYEKFLTNAAIQFDRTSQQNRTYFGMGFRLILKEYHLRTDEKEVDANVLNEQLDFMTGPDVESLTHVKQKLIGALIDISKEYGKFDDTNPQELRDAQAAFSLMLNDYNEEFGLLKQGELISVIGFYGVRITAEVASIYSAAQASMEVQGIFDGLTIVPAPSDNELRTYLRSSKEERPELICDLAIAPAVKLILPSFIRYEEGGYVDSRYEKTYTAEIPLIYRKASLNRVNIDQPIK